MDIRIIITRHALPSMGINKQFRNKTKFDDLFAAIIKVRYYSIAIHSLTSFKFSSHSVLSTYSLDSNNCEKL